ncbi:MAG: mucoidy inhibitor MuiA family protein [Chitinophagales bacterium]|nr:mucoidy inhibitor MuiA family protein [Chitinophagales bacterium]
MKQIALPIIFMMLVQMVIAQTPVKEVGSKIEQVTIFLNGAQIYRTGSSTLFKGRNELIFKNISPNIDKESIQLKGEGKFTIVSVSQRYNYLEESTSKESVKELQKKIEETEAKMEEINIMNEVYKAEEMMLTKNQEITGNISGVKAADLKESIDFQRQRVTEVKTKILENNRNLVQLTEDIQKYSKQIGELQVKRTKPMSEIIVVVEAYENTEATFQLSYFADGAGWTPSYDLKVEQLNQPVNMKYKANVYQSTGEDWKDVQLTLSTGNPQLGGEKPSLVPWYLSNQPPYINNIQPLANKNIRQVSGIVTDASTGEPLIGVSVIVKGTSIGTVTDIDGQYSIAIPLEGTALKFSYIGFQEAEKAIISPQMNIALREENMALEEVVIIGSYGLDSDQAGFSYTPKEKKKYESAYKPLEVTESYQPTTVTFTIAKKYTVLSDGKMNTVEIKNIPIPAEYQYYCAPALDKDAFLTAKITGWEELNLLAGEANLFFEGTYLGKSLINPVISSDTMEISLGRDKGIQIDRIKLKDFSKKQIIGANKVEERTWEITVRNNKKQPIKLILQDQYPTSNRKEVTVDRIEHQDAQLEEETGILTWLIQLPPSNERKVSFKFSVKYPNYLDIYIP